MDNGHGDLPDVCVRRPAGNRRQVRGQDHPLPRLLAVAPGRRPAAGPPADEALALASLAVALAGSVTFVGSIAGIALGYVARKEILRSRSGSPDCGSPRPGWRPAWPGCS